MVNNILIEFTKFALAIVYFTVVFNVSGYRSGVGKMVSIILSIRAFVRLYSSPAACSVETSIATIATFVSGHSWENLLVYSIAAHFGLHRLFLLGNKLIYILASFITAFTNKKQRFKYQAIVIAL
jgi:hypothetical protein